MVLHEAPWLWFLLTSRGLLILWVDWGVDILSCEPRVTHCVFSKSKETRVISSLRDIERDRLS